MLVKKKSTIWASIGWQQWIQLELQREKDVLQESCGGTLNNKLESEHQHTPKPEVNKGQWCLDTVKNFSARGALLMLTEATFSKMAPRRQPSSLTTLLQSNVCHAYLKFFNGLSLLVIYQVQWCRSQIYIDNASANACSAEKSSSPCPCMSHHDKSWSNKIWQALMFTKLA